MATMNNWLFYKISLREFINSMKCTDDLLSILKLIPLNKIKHFLNQQIDEFDLKSSKNMYHTQLPIDEILPCDIFQYMLSFAGFYHTKAVNKQWKQYSEKNERNHLIKLYNPINEIQSSIKYDKNVNTTYIIHQYRKTLHEIEINSGFKGPFDDIEYAIEQSISADRILIHNGVYDVSHAWLNHNLQLIGVGTEVILKCDDTHDPWISIGGASGDVQCNIQNMKCHCESVPSNGCIKTSNNSTLNMENCELQFNAGDEPGYWATETSQLNVNNCKFIAKGIGNKNAFELSPHAKAINIINCNFKNCNVIIDDTFDMVNNEMMQFKCIGNIFDFDDKSCNDLKPITDVSNSDFKDSNKYTLQNNVFKRHNNKMDPNKIF